MAFRINSIAAIATSNLVGELSIEARRALIEREIDRSSAREGKAERMMKFGHGVTRGRPGRKRQATSISCPRHRKELGKLVAVRESAPLAAFVKKEEAPLKGGLELATGV